MDIFRGVVDRISFVNLLQPVMSNKFHATFYNG